MLQTRHIIWGLVLLGCAAAMQVKIYPTQGGKFIGESMYFQCTVVGHAKDIEWYDPRGRKINPGEQDIQVSRDGLTLGITIPHVSLDDAGFHKCVARNEDEQEEVTVLIEIFQTITFTDVPSPQEFNEGDDAEIICNVVSSPQPIVHWLYQGSRINNKNSERMRVLSNHHLQIRSIKKTDEGMYNCEARIPKLGDLAFREIEVRVNAQDNLFNLNNRSAAESDDAVTMTCEASGDPTPTITCSFENRKFPDGAQSHARVSSLVLKNVQFMLAGQYLCTANNSIAQDSKSVYLEVHHVPASPKIQRVEPSSSTAAVVFMEPESNGGLPITQYRVEWALPGLETFINHYTAEENMTQITIDGLKPETTYDVRMSASNSKGESDSTPYTTFKTKPVGFSVENMTQIAIDCLRPEATYEVRISARNIRGVSEASPSSTFKTKPVDVPASPKIQRVEPTSSTAVVVFMEPESNGGLPITQYRVEWALPGLETFINHYTAEENMTQITIDGLKPETTYDVRMSACNSKGESDSTPYTTFKTKPVG